MTLTRTKRSSLVVALLSVLMLLLATPGAATATTAPAEKAPQHATNATQTHTIGYDNYSFLIDGKRTYLWSGEFHYYRLPSPDLWRDVLQKMKAGGFNATSLYFDWGYHSPAPGVYDFTGIRDVDRLLDIAAEVGIYVIARPGPYINAEVDGGGFPTWLSTKPGNTRSNDPVYLRYSDEWQGQIDRIIARHQLTDGRGTVIAYQVENEFYNGSARDYMQHLEDKARADGITVPLTGNHNNTFGSGKAALDVDGVDSYPQGFDCSNPQKWNGVPDISYAKQPGKPLYTAEFQGGAFDPWGGPGYPKCAQLINDQFANVFYKQNIAVGATAQSFYMLYGGTSWGWSAIPQNYTSYDYGAAITESRQFDPKYAQDKLIGYFTRAVTPLAKTDRAPAAPLTAADITDTARSNPDTGTQFHVLRHKDSTSTATSNTRMTLNLGGTGYTVPQQPGTAITLNGRQSKIITANYNLGSTPMRYSTSEIMTHEAIGGRDVAVLYGDKGQPGETVLHYPAQPKVTVLDGSVTPVWDATRGDLRLNYTHGGLARVLITGGPKPLLLLLADSATAGTFWRADTAAGSVLLRGSYLLRTATGTTSTVDLTGDNDGESAIEVFSGASQVSWNGRAVPTRTTPSGSRTGAIPTAQPVSLPALSSWRHQQESQEAQPGFDDSRWTTATRTSSNSITTPGSLPVLFADDYGFHTGNTWYRGRFRYSGKETGISLTAQSGGGAGVYSVWLNGTFLGSSTDATHTFTFPAAALRTNGDNVVSVLTVNQGHEQDYNASNGNKAARGLIGARLTGAPLTTVTWRLQGARGGETLIDPARGPLNTGGLYGERAGWSLPGFPDQGWGQISTPRTDGTPGVSWYRTEATLDTPRGQDTSIGIDINDDPGKHYRALIFVNGWQLGRYVNDVGPQHSFPIPNGVLNPHGRNSIAIAVQNTDAGSGGLGTVKLVNYGSHTSPLAVAQNPAPAYNPATYAMPAAGAVTTLSTPDTVTAGQVSTVTADVAVPKDQATASNVTAALRVPAGWTASAASPGGVPRIDPGGSARFSWRVTAPSGTVPAVNALTVTASFTQRAAAGSASDTRIITARPAAPPAGASRLSALPFLSATNGYGPVERDTSNGEAAAGDGRPITLAGTTYQHGLGTHADADVEFYLAGRCSRFTAIVGLDDEVGTDGSVRFHLLADGREVAGTGVLTGSSASVPIDVPVTGVGVLSLVVDTAGDGNAHDHADWAEPVLTC